MQKDRQEQNRTNLRANRNTEGALGNLNEMAEKGGAHCSTAHGATQETTWQKHHKKKKHSNNKSHTEDTKGDCISQHSHRCSTVNQERPHAKKSTERTVCSTTAVNGATPAKCMVGEAWK